MTTIYYVRHAQPDLRIHDDLTRPLTEKGNADSGRIRVFFRNRQVDMVFSSPYRRALDTIRPVAEEKGLQIQLIENLRERKITENWIEDFDSYCRRQWADFDYKLPAGENLRQVQQRNIDVLEALLDRFPSKSILIGGHGTALATILQFYYPQFGHDDFLKLKDIMPCILQLQFKERECIGIFHHPLP